jgi:16S rRNA (uracil1498-N3)-methyltransferase
MRRIFVKEVKIGKQMLSAANHKYLKKVLRLESGKKIVVFDGQHEADAIFLENSIEITQVYPPQILQNHKKIFIPSIKKVRFEWMIEKLVELGIGEIWVIQTENTQDNFNLNRIELIMQSALKQSLQVTSPKIVLTNFDEFIQNFKGKNIAYASLLSENTKVDGIDGIAIGPEGGWSPKEESTLALNQFIPLKLTNTVLRTETAAICAALKLMA